MVEIPNLFCWFALREEEEVRRNAGIGVKYPVRQSDDGMEVAIGEEFFLDAGRDAFSEKESVWQYHSRASSRFQNRHNEHKEEERRFRRLELGGEIMDDAGFYLASERRIGNDRVDRIVRSVVFERPRQGIVVPEVRRAFDPVEDEIGGREKVGELFEFDSSDGALEDKLVVRGFHVVRADVLDGAREESSGAARGIENGFAQFRSDHIDDELRQGPRRVVFTRVPGRLEVVQDLFVDFVEEMEFRPFRKVDLVDLVGDLPEQHARFHIVERILEHALDDPGHRVLSVEREVPELFKKRLVHELDQFVAGHPFVVGGPVPPLAVFGHRRNVAVAEDFQVLFLVVEDL